MKRFGGVASLLLLACGGPSRPSTVPVPRDAGSTARYFESIRNDSLRLIPFLRAMPKGGDLHNHLGGAIYAESFIQWAAADGLCIVTATLTLTPPPCDPSAGRPPATTITRDRALSDKVVDSWSMRDFDYSRGIGHDHFFDTFAKFGLAGNRRVGDMLAEASSRAATDHVSYLELMQTLDGGAVAALGANVGFMTDFGALRGKLLAAGLRDTLVRAMQALDSAEARRNALLRCGSDRADSGCGVTVRYLYQVLRGLPAPIVFAQILAGFELARLDHRVVGFNLVMPEDAAVPMRDFRLHMSIIEFLHRLYPDVHISLHAGELNAQLVPPDGLTFHIRESILKGNAERIGHGVDVMRETDAEGLLKVMAERHTLVEIALTSNDGILGVRGTAHPLAAYLSHHVPVALVTDDEGVSRSDMTHEYLRAAVDQRLDYGTLRELARNSIGYSFAEPALKARLLKEWVAAIAAFEARWTGR